MTEEVKTCPPKETEKEKIDKAKERNQKERIESDCKKAWNDGLMKDIEALEKEHQGIGKILEEYKAAYPNLMRAIECIKKDHEKWKKDIENEIPCTDDPNREGIDKEIDKVDNNIDKLECCVKALEGPSVCEAVNEETFCSEVEKLPRMNVDCPELPCSSDNDAGRKVAQNTTDGGTSIPTVNDLVGAEKDYKCSGEFHEKKEKRFNELKNSKKNNEETLKILKDLQALIEKETNKYKRYFHISDLGDALEEIIKCGDREIYKPEGQGDEKGHKELLIEAWKLLFCAKKDLRKKEYVKCIVNNTLEAIKKNLEDAKKMRDNDILEKIDEISK